VFSLGLYQRALCPLGFYNVPFVIWSRSKMHFLPALCPLSNHLKYLTRQGFLPWDSECFESHYAPHLNKFLARTVMHRDVTAMHGDVTVMHGDVTVMHGDVTVMHGDVTVMHGDVTVMD